MNGARGGYNPQVFMLRRSLFLFAVFALLALSLTALYAIFRLRGPEDVLAEARDLLQRGENGAAVSVLDQCEPGASFRDNPALLHELWRLRLTAHRRLDNAHRALKDVEDLLQAGDKDPDLLQNRIYYLARLGQGALARQHALEFIAQYPDSARGQELAGEACQVEYREALQQVATRVQGDLDSQHEQQGQDALLEYLYRPPGDDGIAAALATLADLYGRQARFQQAWPRLQESLRDLRDRVQQALAFWQRSLELARPAAVRQSNFLVAAFRGVTLSMEQAHRPDDLVAQAEIYLSSFDHRFTAEAAAAAARVHLQDGLCEAAVDVARRYLPGGRQRARIDAGKLDAGVENLLVVEASALYRLGRAPELDQLGNDVRELMAAGLQLPLANATANAFAALLRGKAQAAETNLAIATGLLLRTPAPARGDDPLEQLMPMRLSLLRARKAGLPQTLALLDDWAHARPTSTVPLLERSKEQLAQGQAQAAMATAAGLLDAHPLDEPALRQLAAAADQVYRDSGQNGDGLVLQCMQRATLRPDVPHPVCYLLCCEAALRQNEAGIARESARAAVDQYPWARWPRHLEARAELAAGSASAAVAVLDKAIEADPDDVDALTMWFDTSRSAGLPVAAHLAQVVQHGVGGPEVATELLRLALRENSPATVTLARAAGRRQDAPGELLALAAQALARDGDPAGAQALLDRARTLLGDKPAPAAANALALATIQWLAALAPTTADAGLAARAGELLQQAEPSGAEAAASLLALAETLESADHAQTAYLFARTALAIGDAIETRDARWFLLAGRLALRLGCPDQARAHWTAALSFPDGAPAAASLARLELLLQPERAREAFAMATPDDPALVYCCAAPEKALPLAQQRAQLDPGDLLAQVVLALLAPPAAGALGAELHGADETLRTEVATAAAVLAEPQLAAAALPRLRTLAAAQPGSLAIQLLLARALTDAGQDADAGALQATAFAAGSRDPVLLAEIVRTAGHARRPPPAAILTELQQRAMAGSGELPPAVLAFAVRSLALEAALAGHPDAAARMLAGLWVGSPDSSGVTVEEALSLLRQGRPQDGIVLLDHLRRTRSGAEQRAAADALFAAGIDQAPALGAAVADALQRGARDELAMGRRRGAPLAFLIADGKRLAGVPEADQVAWIEALLHDCATGQDNWVFGQKALHHLEATQGAGAALAVVERVLQAHPEWLLLWVERARLLLSQRHAVDGLAAARAALAFGDDPDAAIDFLILAAEQRNLQTSDLDLFAHLPKARLDAPLGRYLRGLVALRQGRADAAEALLADAAPRPSGFHLYARALANLIRQQPAARATAARLFAQLAADYANSSLARYCGSFARQLAPN